MAPAGTRCPFVQAIGASPAATAQDNGPKSGCYPVIVRNSWANREITQEIRDRFRAVGEANKGKSLSQATRAKISVHSRGETNPNAKVTDIQVALIKGLLTTSRPSVTSVIEDR